MHGPSVAEVIARVEVIASIGNDDPEASHVLEDQLHRDVLRAIASGHVEEPVALAAAALGTNNLEFPRWYA